MQNDAEKILYSMLLIRRVEEEIVSRYPKQLMRCPVHLSISQEAIAVGACHHLKKEDSVFSTHRSHAHYLAKGGSLEKMVLEIHGKIGGCQDGRGGSMHLNDIDVNVMSIPIVASSIPLAVGAAMANKMDGNGNIVVCFFGDAAVEEGVFSESMNFAALHRLPIVFVCENNQYSVDTHLDKRRYEKRLEMLGAAHGIFTLRLNGNNALDISHEFKRWVLPLRSEPQPIFFIFDIKRSYVHCGVDKEFELEDDPLNHTGISDMGAFEVSQRILEIDNKIKAAFDAAETAPLPTPDMAKEFVYA